MNKDKNKVSHSDWGCSCHFHELFLIYEKTSLTPISISAKVIYSRFAHLLSTILILLKTFYISRQAKDNFGGKNIMNFYLLKRNKASRTKIA